MHATIARNFVARRPLRHTAMPCPRAKVHNITRPTQRSASTPTPRLSILARHHERCPAWTASAVPPWYQPERNLCLPFHTSTAQHQEPASMSLGVIWARAIRQAGLEMKPMEPIPTIVSLSLTLEKQTSLRSACGLYHDIMLVLLTMETANPQHIQPLNNITFIQLPRPRRSPRSGLISRIVRHAFE